MFLKAMAIKAAVAAVAVSAGGVAVASVTLPAPPPAAVPAEVTGVSGATGDTGTIDGVYVSRSLPATGSNPMPLVVAGLSLVLLGLGLTRRRRSA